jgi:hypothetical protein
VTLPLRGQRGIALVASMFVLVVLAALLTGLFYAGLQEFRIGRNTVLDQRAFNAAEAGLDATLARWDAARLNRLGPNDSAAFSGSLPRGTGSYSGTVLRLNDWLFLIRSTGTDGSGTSQRTLAVVARLAPLQLASAAALGVGGKVSIGAAGLVDGLGVDPDGGTCPRRRTPASGLVVGDMGNLSMAECPTGSCARGSPPVREDPAVGLSPVPFLGEVSWASLAGSADTILPGGPSWLPGPVSPVVYAAGDLSVNGGGGEGVLLVQGNLVLDGGTRLVGLVAVRGTLVVRGGAWITGAVLAGAAVVGGQDGEGRTVVAYSGCAVERALAAAAQARRLRERAWTELH